MECLFFFFKKKKAYEMRISDWSSDVCSSDLSVTRDIEPRTLLVQLLRDILGMTGTHVGCDTSQCGACVVHVDGRSVKSCTMLAAQAQGATVTTIEGLAASDGRSAARRVGKEWVSKCRVRWAP